MTTPATTTSNPTTTSQHGASGRRRRRTAAAAGAVAALLAAAAAAPAAHAATHPSAGTTATTTTAAAPSSTSAFQRDLARLVRQDGYPGAEAAVRGRDGRTRHVAAGVGDLRTGAPMPTDGEVRIGSNTKTFTAVTVLQLVGEGKVSLDRSVDTYLPGLLRGNGIDGRDITVRQLLQHESGLPNYTSYLADGLLEHLHEYREPRGLLDLALAQQADFAPGAKFEYSNTNYLVLGLLVEAVTQRPVGEEITHRIIDRIGLRHTSFPVPGDQHVPGVHPQAYHADDPAKPLVDVTRQDPSFGWAAGQMISTPSDLNRFFSALLAGKLLKPAQLAQMQRTVPAPELGAGVRYGLGLVETPLSCGGVSWGHGGDITGYATVNAVTTDGRAAAIATTRLPRTTAQIDRSEQLLDEALCTP